MKYKMQFANLGESSNRARDITIDRLRGALVILMVCGDYLAGISWVPSFLKHAPDIGFTVADTVAPAFVFVMGLNYGNSFRRRLQLNGLGVYRYFTMRFLLLLCIGTLITAGSTLVDRSEGWNVLQSLGIAGLITLIFIRLPIWTRLAIAVGMLITYQYLLDTALLEAVLGSGHGGLFGSFSWSALLLLSTAVADIFRRGLRAQYFCLSALAVVASFSAWLIPVSKNRVSLSYILLGLTLSAATYFILKLSAKSFSNREGALTWWGKHALPLYITHLLALSVFGLSEVQWWYAEAAPWLVVLQLSAILGFMTFVAKRLEIWSNHRAKPGADPIRN